MKSPDELFPDRLRVVDGRLTLTDGGDVEAYLREWATAQGIGPDTPLSLGTRDQAVRLYRDAMLGFYIAA